MTDEKTYIQNDLIDYADLDNAKQKLCSDTWNKGNRADWLYHALPDADIQTWFSGGYQGKFVFVIRTDDYIWLHNGYYGSCSVCDGFIQRKPEYTEDMLKKAYCFETVDDAKTYISQTDDYSWSDQAKNQAQTMLDNPDKGLKESSNYD